jgi:hypothetical protein
LSNKVRDLGESFSSSAPIARRSSTTDGGNVQEIVNNVQKQLDSQKGDPLDAGFNQVQSAVEMALRLREAIESQGADIMLV